MSCIQVKGMRKGNCKKEFIQVIEHIKHDRGHILKRLGGTMYNTGVKYRDNIC